jgi:hypothetical protein
LFIELSIVAEKQGGKDMVEKSTAILKMPTEEIQGIYYQHHGEEQDPLSRAAYKPVCWFHYVGDTFVVWLAGPEKQNDFLNYFSSIYFNIQFTS